MISNQYQNVDVANMTEVMNVNEEKSHLEDNVRIQKVLDEIGAATNNKSAAQGKSGNSFEIDEAGEDLLMEYMDEMVCAVLEESSLLARHRKSDILEIQDIQLILLKKFGIEVPGAPKPASLHKQSISSRGTSRSKLLTGTSKISEKSDHGNAQDQDQIKATKKRRRPNVNERSTNTLDLNKRSQPDE